MAKQPVGVKLFYSGQWNNHATDTLIGNDIGQEITITRGRATEQEQAPPSQCKLSFLGHDLNPENVLSPLYGLIGRNTPLRVEIGTEHPAAVGSGLSDTTSHVAPSVDSPTASGLLLCVWAAPNPGGTYTVPGSMIAGPTGTDARTRIAAARQSISAIGATGTRTAAFSASEQYVSASLLLHGTSPAQGSSAAFSTIVNTTTGSAGHWWVVASYFGWDDVEDTATPAFPRDTDGGGWLLLGDTGILNPGDAEADYFRLKVWAKQINTTPPHSIRVDNPGGVASIQSVLMRVTNVDDFSIRFSGEVAAWVPRQTLGGPNTPPVRWVEVTAAGITRRLGQGADPLQDPVDRLTYRHFDRLAGYWPMNDPDGSRQINAVVGTPLKLSFANFRQLPRFGVEVAPWLAPGVETQQNAGAMQGRCGRGLAGGFAADYAYRAVLGSGTDEPVGLVVSVRAGGIRYDAAIGAGEDLTLQVVDEEGGSILDTNTVGLGELQDGQPHHVRLRIIDAAGTDANIFIDVDGVNRIAITVNVGETTISRPTNVLLFWQALTGFTLPVRVTKIAVWNGGASPGLADVYPAYTGYATETTDQRVIRLADEQDVELVTVGDPALSPPAGPQHPDEFLEILAEAAETGQSIRTDARQAVALLNRTAESLYNQLATLELDYDQAQIGDPLLPAIDDQATRNDITVTGRGGGTARATLETGPLSIQPPPAGVGRVQTSPTIQPNVAEAVQLADQAGWRLLLGTIAGTRFPRIIVDLDAAPTLAPAAGRVDVGHRITVDNLPTSITAVLASLLVQGYAETIDSHRRIIAFDCVPAEPYQIAELEHAQYGVIQSNAAVTAEALDTTETGVDINAGAGPDWLYEADMVIEIGGEWMTVTAVGAMSGSFPNRTCTLTVVRSVNGIVKSHASGTPVRFAHRAYIGL